MKKILTFAAVAFVTVQSMAQVQQGLVKTIGRPNKPGVVLADVMIRVRGLVNSVVSSPDGSFLLT